MDKNLTNPKARQQVYEYLQRTLDALPRGASLALTPDVDRQAFSLGNESACSDSDNATAENSPVYFSASYWVNGVPNGKQKDYVSRMEKLWTSWGWTQQKKVDPEQTTFDSPEGYSLGVINADNGPGGVSLFAKSPCFWDKHGDARDAHLTDEQPHTFKQR